MGSWRAIHRGRARELTFASGCGRDRTFADVRVGFMPLVCGHRPEKQIINSMSYALAGATRSPVNGLLTEVGYNEQ
jgi:hypothetical protein